MSSPSSVGEAAAPSRPSHKSFLDELVETFTSPMAWLLIVALVITWSAVAIVLFDLLDYKTLAEYTSYCDDPVCLYPGLPPPPAIAKRVLKARVCQEQFNLNLFTGGVRPIKPRHAVIPADVTAQESTDWLEMIWSFAASLFAPDDEEEEGIHQLTETLTSFHSEEL